MAIFQNGNFLNILGIILIALGTFSMFMGNRILSNQSTRLMVNQMETFIKGNLKTTSIDQIINTVGILSEENDINLMVSNLTMPEKFFLLMFIGGYKKMDQKAIFRMLKLLAENLKPPFTLSPENNPFQEVIDSLTRKKIIVVEGTSLRPTNLGQKIVSVLIRSKIPPFDEI